MKSSTKNCHFPEITLESNYDWSSEEYKERKRSLVTSNKTSVCFYDKNQLDNNCQAILEWSKQMKQLTEQADKNGWNSLKMVGLAQLGLTRGVQSQCSFFSLSKMCSNILLLFLSRLLESTVVMEANQKCPQSRQIYVLLFLNFYLFLCEAT